MGAPTVDPTKPQDQAKLVPTSPSVHSHHRCLALSRGPFNISSCLNLSVDISSNRSPPDPPVTIPILGEAHFRINMPSYGTIVTLDTHQTWGAPPYVQLDNPSSPIRALINQHQLPIITTRLMCIRKASSESLWDYITRFNGKAPKGIQNHKLNREFILWPPRTIRELDDVISRHISMEEMKKSLNCNPDSPTSCKIHTPPRLDMQPSKPNTQPLKVIYTITGKATVGGFAIRWQRTYAREVLNLDALGKHHKQGVLLTFTDDDACNVRYPHDDPLIIPILFNNVTVH
ncbi:hypothetical protein ACLOJK_021149 [Asimina triloba]